MMSSEDFRQERVRAAALRGEGADVSDLELNELEAATAEYAAGLMRSWRMDINEAITKACAKVFSRHNP